MLHRNTSIHFTTYPWRWRDPRPTLAHSVAAGLRRLARHLYRSSRGLKDWARARQPVATPRRDEPLPRIEYCSEAGAPEGALFIDGCYVGSLPVDRL